jgi:hypothetical protein
MLEQHLTEKTAFSSYRLQFLISPVEMAQAYRRPSIVMSERAGVGG